MADFSLTLNLAGRTAGGVSYTEAKGCGLVDPSRTAGKTDSEKALHAGGWNARSRSGNDGIRTGNGVFMQDPRGVVICRIDVPEYGTYRVGAVLRAGKTAVSGAYVFAGRRNLCAGPVSIPAGGAAECSFYTCVTPYIPALTPVPCLEKAVYVSVTGGAGLEKVTVSREDVPVIWVAGDSTLTDQDALAPYWPAESCTGWAQVLSRFVQGAAVCNQAHSGLTTNCFRDDGHWEIIRDRMKPGDVLIVQFGHNDQKRRNLAAFGGYIDNLRWYAREAEKRGVRCVICSPISRIPFMDRGRMRSLLEWHADAAQKAADESGAAFIDLHRLTFDFWCAAGERARLYFQPGDGTHTCTFGGEKIAEMAVQEILRQCIDPLDRWICMPMPDFPEPESGQGRGPQPEEKGDSRLIDIPYVDIAGIPQYDSCVKALRLGLLDPCVMHLHPAEPMPRGQFLMVYLRAAGMSGTRPYEGRFCDLSRYEWGSDFVQTCLNEHLLDLSTVPDDRFRPDDPLTAGEFADFAVRALLPADRRDQQTIAASLAEAVREGLVPAGVTENQSLCRADCYAGLVRLMELEQERGRKIGAAKPVHPAG
ncbi:MAG: GDSL-type esterase/lipase family protein [Lachnospiraceae bacterium]|jgi:lysophospholipase L1-like esterase